MARQCILFTGHSGIGAIASLTKLIGYVGRQGVPAPLLVKIEAEMVNHHLDSYPEDPNRSIMEQPGGFQYLLLQPKDYLRQLWRTSTQRAIQAIPQDGPPDQTVFLSMHSVFYHTSSRDFFGCGDVGYLTEQLGNKDVNITKIITLIDDVDDCWIRLKGPGQLFDSTKDVVQSILDLMMLLYWRSVEIFASEQIARELGIPHIVLAIKHPLSVAHDLMFSQKTPIYIAHPISEIRRLSATGNQAEAQTAMQEIRELTTLLVNSDVVVPFFPTSIDELRILDEPPGSGNFQPKLSDRWEFPNVDETLYVPPSGSGSGPFALGLPSGTSETEALSLLLKGLHEAILSQVDSRDRRLVEQARSLIAWRPCFKGHISSGVDNEIRHRNSLLEYGVINKDQNRAFVLMRAEDIGRYRIDKTFRQIEVRNADVAASITPTSVKDRLTGSIMDSISCVPGTLSGGELENLVDPNHEITFPLSSLSGSTLGPDRGVASRSERAQTWNELAAQCNDDVPPFVFLPSDSVTYDSQGITIPEFVRHVEQNIS